jgi:hypothetical protein
MVEVETGRVSTFFVALFLECFGSPAGVKPSSATAGFSLQVDVEGQLLS